MLRSLSVLLVASTFACASVVTPRQGEYNDGVHLAIEPTCGRLTNTSDTPDVNAALFPLSFYKTIVAFGDSFTDGGKRDGSPLDPPVIIPPSPKAGGRTTNGPVWIENISNDIGARFMDYAVGGAVTDRSLWPSKANNSDFLTQVGIFLDQNNKLNPLNTLYTIFFGINDYSASRVDGNKLPAAAQVVIDQIKKLAGPPTFARSFLITDCYGRGNHVASGEEYKQIIYKALKDLHYGPPFLQVGFVDFAYLWDGILGTVPGYQAFGYTSIGGCTKNSSSLADLCEDPDHTFSWIPNHPSKQTHRVMADYVKQALKKCWIL